MAGDIAHLVLGIGGMIPGYGILFDAIDAALYIAEGDYVNAALTFAPEILGAGITTGIKAAKWVSRADKISDARKAVATVVKNSDELSGVVKSSDKIIDISKSGKINIDGAINNGQPLKNHRIVFDSEASSLSATKQAPNSSADLLNPDGSVKQRRYYDIDGKAKMDIDFNHTDDGTHEFPHIHIWDWTKKPPRQ